MTRDPGLEQLLADDLTGLTGVTTTKMFGGFAWMWQGHLLCGARADDIPFRLGKGNDAWALAQQGVVPMMSGDRLMQGGVRLTGEVIGDDAQRLLAAAKTFAATLPPK
jgi:hypothetical protein